MGKCSQLLLSIFFIILCFGIIKLKTTSSNKNVLKNKILNKKKRQKIYSNYRLSHISAIYKTRQISYNLLLGAFINVIQTKTKFVHTNLRNGETNLNADFNIMSLQTSLNSFQHAVPNPTTLHFFICFLKTISHNINIKIK